MANMVVELGLTAGLDDLKGLFQHQHFYDSALKFSELQFWCSPPQPEGSEFGIRVTHGSCSCLTTFPLLLLPQQLQQRSAENLISDTNVAAYCILIRKCYGVYFYLVFFPSTHLSGISISGKRQSEEFSLIHHLNSINKTKI